MVGRLLVISFLVLAIVGCKKPADRTCFKTIGDERYIDTMLTSFDTLKLYDDIQYRLISDTIFKVEVIGGENLVSHVGIENQNNSLTITNNNKCKFLRRLDNKIQVNVHVEDLNYIHYEGSEELKTFDTLYSSELRLFIRDGVGEVDLTVENGYTSGVVSHGWGGFTIRGTTLYAYLNCSTNSTCDTRSLKVENDLKINSNTQGDMIVNAEGLDYFECEINQRGNVLYEGTPNATSFIYNHEGEIIHLNN